jgi:hypothetical protein
MGVIIAVLARRLPVLVVATILGVAVLADLRLAAMDLPQRHAVPSEVVEVTRPVPAYLQGHHADDRILSVARTEYELNDIAAIDGRHPGQSDAERFWFTSAMKLDEVMSPNVPLRYGLNTADGYDGGVLPLRRYLDIASLLVPREELRSDGVLRTRLIAVPEARLLDLLGISAVIAGRAANVELDGVRYDVATARTLAPGDRVMVNLPGPLQISAIGLLASVAESSDTSAGELVLTRDYRLPESIPLRTGQEVYGELAPGPSHADLPTAGPSRAPRKDTAVRIPVADGPPVTSLEWIWTGPGRLTLRAATAISGDGSQRQLVLQEGLNPVEFPSQRLFLRSTLSTTALIPVDGVRGDARDDASALAWLKSATAEELKSQVAIAPETSTVPVPGDLRNPAGRSSAPATFERLTSSPERIVYRRLAEGNAGLLVIPDAWFPGWRAEVDGQPASVVRANILFKAVFVPYWGQQVTLIYDPISVRVGAVISILALVIWIVFMVRGGIGIRGMSR